MNFTPGLRCCQNATEPGVSILHRTFTAAGGRASRQRSIEDFRQRAILRAEKDAESQILVRMGRWGPRVFGFAFWWAAYGMQERTLLAVVGAAGRVAGAARIAAVLGFGDKRVSPEGCFWQKRRVLGQRIYARAARSAFFSPFCAFLPRFNWYWATPLMPKGARYQKCCPKPGGSCRGGGAGREGQAAGGEKGGRAEVLLGRLARAFLKISDLAGNRRARSGKMATWQEMVCQVARF